VVVTTRGRAIAAAVSALLAMVLAAAIAGRGCGAEDSSPVGAVRAFVTAARAGDRAAVHELLGPRTRAYLEEQAARAGELAGGARRFEPRELMSVGAGTLGQAPPRDIVLRERDGADAVVEIVGAEGTREPIQVVKVNGHWRIELR